MNWAYNGIWFEEDLEPWRKIDVAMLIEVGTRAYLGLNGGYWSETLWVAP